MPRRLFAALPPIASVALTIPVTIAINMPTGVTMAAAQTTAPARPPAPAKHKPDPYGSPLDTIMSTHLWTNVPEAQDFVRETRPAAKDLRYTPLTGKDPDRPKPRDAANVMALQAELEQDGARNAARARGLLPVKQRRIRKRAGNE